MKNILTPETILEFIDVPQLFLARDKFDTRYLCLLYEDEPECKYSAIRISTERYSEFLQGKIDLRSLYERPEFDKEFFDVEYSNKSYVVTPATLASLPEERLPEEDYFYEDNEIESITVKIPKKEKSFLLNLLKYRGWVAM